MTDKEIKIIMDKMDKLTDDSLFMSDLETIEMYEKEERAIRAYGEKLATEKGLAKGMAQGIAQGAEQKTKEMILSMMENKIDINMISKITNKTIEEINKIIE